MTKSSEGGQAKKKQTVKDQSSHRAIPRNSVSTDVIDLEKEQTATDFQQNPIRRSNSENPQHSRRVKIAAAGILVEHRRKRKTEKCYFGETILIFARTQKQRPL
uniref:Uncharacterized protein n=1 Tax=Oryza punctata TaxID=4537 RepID=A0A0E0KEV3_ORYPU